MIAWAPVTPSTDSRLSFLYNRSLLAARRERQSTKRRGGHFQGFDICFQGSAAASLFYVKVTLHGLSMRAGEQPGHSFIRLDQCRVQRAAAGWPCLWQLATACALSLGPSCRRQRTKVALTTKATLVLSQPRLLAEISRVQQDRSSPPVDCMQRHAPRTPKAGHAQADTPSTI